MPLANNNYVTPAWIDNAAPPINDDELNAMSQTLEGSQILVGNGAPTSSTQGKVGQRYADISTTPETIYELKQTNPNVWKAVLDQNANTARPYSTGGSYAAGDYCIHEGRLWKALDATGSAWDGSKWERARYAEDLGAHVADEENPHNVTAAQTGAISPTVLATMQATTAAVRDYCAGEYFIYEGQFYELKEDVEQGGDLFGPRTPDTVSVYELDTWYEAELFDSNQPDAQVTQSGFMLTSYRTARQQSTVMVESHAKYFYAWIQDASSTQSAMVYYSSDVNDFPNANLSTVVYYETTNTAGLNAMWHGTVNRGIKAGEYYYIVIPQIYFPDLQTLVRRPVNARMFSGTESDLFNFIGGISTQKKSEPAVLGDGIAELSPKTGSIALSAVWTGEDPYSQTATLTGATVTGKSKIDLTPTAAQLSQLAEDGVISLLIENNGGTLTAWAVGAQPSTAMTIACTVTETV